MITDDETKEMISRLNIYDLGKINKEEEKEEKTQEREYK